MTCNRRVGTVDTMFELKMCVQGCVLRSFVLPTYSLDILTQFDKSLRCSPQQRTCMKYYVTVGHLTAITACLRRQSRLCYEADIRWLTCSGIIAQCTQYELWNLQISVPLRTHLLCDFKVAAKSHTLGRSMISTYRRLWRTNPVAGCLW